MNEPAPAVLEMAESVPAIVCSTRRLVENQEALGEQRDVADADLAEREEEDEETKYEYGSGGESDVVANAELHTTQTESYQRTISFPARLLCGAAEHNQACEDECYLHPHDREERDPLGDLLEIMGRAKHTLGICMHLLTHDRIADLVQDLQALQARLGPGLRLLTVRRESEKSVKTFNNKIPELRGRAGVDVRIRTPQKFAVGTRVANPLEGRTGVVDNFDVDTGLYTLLFNDGHSEQVDEAGAVKFAIKTQTDDANSSNNSTSTRRADMSTAGDGGEDDPQILLGAAVSKTVKSYDSKESVVSGHVLTYFSDVGKYRVSFSDDSFAEWTRDEVIANVEATKLAAEKKTSDSIGSSSNSKKRLTDDDSKLHKKKKKHKHNKYNNPESDDEDERSIVVEPQEEEEEPMQLNQMKYPSRAAAYTIIRKVLCVILAQSTIKKMRTEKQIAVLNNEDIKPKRALESFVEAGGLSCLQKVLVIWMRKPMTHSGALLILKVLAALPGVTPDAVLQSNIGKTLRGISNVCQTMGHVDQVLGDLAEWIIRSWKRNVIRKSLNMSAKDLIKENSSELRAVDTLPLYVPPPPTAEKNMTEKQLMTNHLRKLLSGEIDAQLAAKAAAVAAKKNEEDVIFLPRFNSLGSEDARRPVRQTILLDTLAAKINREHVEGLKKYQQALEAKRAAEEEEAKTGAGDANAHAASTSAISNTSNSNRTIWDQDGRDEVSIGRLMFGRPQILMFNKNVCVVNMLSTDRSRALARQSVAGGDDAVALDEEVAATELPPANKIHAPKKSILKAVKEVAPVTEMNWEQYVVTVE